MQAQQPDSYCDACGYACVCDRRPVDRSGPWRESEFASLYLSDLLVLWSDLKHKARGNGLLTRLDFESFCALAFRSS
jgi:hypothetical protein